MKELHWQSLHCRTAGSFQQVDSAIRKFTKAIIHEIAQHQETSEATETTDVKRIAFPQHGATSAESLATEAGLAQQKLSPVTGAAG